VKSISGKQFARILENRGWNLIRVDGNHHVYMKPGNPARISLPVHGNEDLKIVCSDIL
jgi:predicted RNA binding protein YcfA (HicA-like mRNA interferase family)